MPFRITIAVLSAAASGFNTWSAQRMDHCHSAKSNKSRCITANVSRRVAIARLALPLSG